VSEKEAETFCAPPSEGVCMCVDFCCALTVARRFGMDEETNETDEDETDGMNEA